MQEVNQLGRAGSCFAVLFLGACHATPQLQLSAADSMDLLAASLQTSLDEYRDDVNDFDEERRIAVIDAFVARVRADHDKEDQLAAHAVAFSVALNRIEEDREAEWARRTTALENIETLSEIADGLRRSAVESMKLDEQARQYLTDVISRASVPPEKGESSGP